MHLYLNFKNLEVTRTHTHYILRFLTAIRPSLLLEKKPKLNFRPPNYTVLPFVRDDIFCTFSFVFTCAVFPPPTFPPLPRQNPYNLPLCHLAPSPMHYPVVFVIQIISRTVHLNMIWWRWRTGRRLCANAVGVCVSSHLYCV